MHCNVVNNNCQQGTKVLFKFISDKQFGQLITVSTHSLTVLKTITQNFRSLKYGLQIKTIDPLKYRAV